MKNEGKGCDDKHRFATNAEALAAMQGRLKDGNARMRRTKPVSTKVYHCTFCNGFHLYTEGKRRTFSKHKPKEIRSIPVYKKDNRLIVRNYSSRPVR